MPRLLLGPSIVVEVGTPPTEFAVHETLITNYSGFFKDAMDGHFEDSKTRRVHLNEDSPDLFLRLIKWLYTGEVDMREHKIIGDEEGVHENVHDEPVNFESDEANGWSAPMRLKTSFTIDEIFKLWILGDKLRMPELQNDVAHSLIKFTADNIFNCTAPSNETLAYVYEYTIKTSPIRLLAINVFLFVCRSDLSLDDSSTKTLSPEILEDITQRSFNLWRNDTRSPSSSILRRHQSYVV